MASSTHRAWGWLYRESRPFARFQAASLLCIAASGAANLVPPLIMKWLIDDVLANRRWGALAAAAGLLLVAAVSKSALAQVGGFINMLGVKRMTFRTHMRLVRHVQSRSAAFHARQPIGDLLQRLERDVTAVGDFAENAMPALAGIVVGTVMAVAAMVYLDWRLASVVALFLPVFVFVRHRYRTILEHWADAVREAIGRQSSMLQEMLTGAIQIQLLGAERRLAREYTRLGLKTMEREMLQRRHELLYILASMSLIGVATAVVIGYGGMRVLTGQLTTGALVAFYGYIGSIFLPVNNVVGLFARVIRAHASIHRLIELEQTSDVIPDAPEATSLSSPPQMLTMKNVAFDYGPDKPLLRNVHFHARAGERVVVVGESGSGKSSLLKLVARLYETADGRIELDGRDIRSVRLDSLRQTVSLVPQDPVLFQGTLRANLRYACPTATPDEINRAAWVSCLTEVIERLPQGLDTQLGRMGEGLSGGEKQRVAIARALLQQRPILILDEAFSALDSATERRLLARLEQWAVERQIVILVSHRLAPAQWADRVVVVHEGRVVEDASHEKLYREGTHYNALWQSREAEGVGSAEEIGSR